jgi:hypothetical protein
MRVILGLDAPDAGRALVGGQPYTSLRHPLSHVGPLLDASALHRAQLHPGHRLRPADGAAEWLLRVTPAAGFAIQQSIPQYAQVSAQYAPPVYFPLLPWAGFAVLCGYAAVALTAAYLLLRRRAA